MSNYKLVTDGAYSSSRNQGGAAFVILRDGELVLEHSKRYKNCTNNQMEMIAIISGLKCIKKPIDKLVIISDSMYCIGCMSLEWKRRKNKRLWEEFDKQYERVLTLCSDIEFQHVKGHNGDKWNEYVDKLATTASKRIGD